MVILIDGGVLSSMNLLFSISLSLCVFFRWWFCSWPGCVPNSELNDCVLVAAVRIMFNLYKNASLATWPRPLFDFLRRASPHQSFHWLKNFLAVKGWHYASFFESHF